MEIGIHGVPFFVFNDKYAVSGAQQTEVFHDSARTYLARVSISRWKVIAATDSRNCDDGSCAI